MKQNKSLAAAFISVERASGKSEQLNLLAHKLTIKERRDLEKVKKYVKTYGSTSKQFAQDVQQMIITLPEKPSKLATGHLTPAHGRLCITSAHVLDWFNRGFDFENNDPHVPGRYASIRDFAPGAKIQFRYGKRLQKTFIHTV